MNRSTMVRGSTAVRQKRHGRPVLAVVGLSGAATTILQNLPIHVAQVRVITRAPSDQGCSKAAFLYANPITEGNYRPIRQ